MNLFHGTLKKAEKLIDEGKLKEAEKIAFWNGYKGTVVISGEGVKEYYKKKGYYEKDTFMYRDFYKFKQFVQITQLIFTVIVFFSNKYSPSGTLFVTLQEAIKTSNKINNTIFVKMLDNAI